MDTAPPEVTQKITFSKDAIVQEARRVDLEHPGEGGLVNVHRHVEGTLNAPELKEVALSIKSSANPNAKMTFEELPWDEIAVYMNQGTEPSMGNFFSKLSTRWMRLMLIHGLMHPEMELTAEDILKPLFNKILSKAQAEGIRELDLLASPMSMTKEGNLTKLPIPKGVSKEEEMLEAFDFLAHHEEGLHGAYPQAAQAWKEKYDQFARETGDIKDKLPTMREYCEIFRKCVEENSGKYVWAGGKIDQENDKRMEVGLRFCLRRDPAAPETDLIINKRGKRLSLAGQEFAREMRQLYADGLIDGFDLAGYESKPEYRLRNFSAFLGEMRRSGPVAVPFTVHAGELKPDQAKLAYDNLRAAIEYGAVRIGHAVRLFDDTPEANKLLRLALERGVFFEINLTSNLWTGVVKDIHNHPILRALRGEHSLFSHDYNLYKKLLTHIIVCDDDPVVFNQAQIEADPTAAEIALLARETDNLGGFDKVRAFLKFLRDNARRALLWRQEVARNHTDSFNPIAVGD